MVEFYLMEIYVKMYKQLLGVQSCVSFSFEYCPFRELAKLGYRNVIDVT